MSESVFDFVAPKLYYDLNDDLDQEPVDDSYFDCESSIENVKDSSKTPKRNSKKTPYKTPKPTAVSCEDDTSEHKEMECTNAPDECMEVCSTEVINDNNNSNKKDTLKKKSLQRTSLQEITQGVPARQSPRLAAIAKAIRRSNANRNNQNNAVGSKQIRRRSVSHDSALAPTRASMAKAKPPKKIHKLNGMKGLSVQDQQDLENIAQFKNKISSNKKHAENNNVKPGLTKVKAFNFATNSRLRSQTASKDDTPVDFTRSLRSRTTSNNDAPKGPTKVQPFNLSEPNKPKSQPSEFISLAELNVKFHTDTPARFSRKPSEPEPHKQGTGVTIPHTPKLSTNTRSRPVNVPTREEMEEKELQEALKHQFKAKPLNKKVFDAPSSGYQIEKKITVPEPFDITDSKKSELSHSTSNLLAMSNKYLSSASLASIPHSGIKYKWEKHSTEVKPFSFDDRDKNTQQKKLEKIKKTLEEEKKLAEFHAKPMPAFEAGITGVPIKKPPTPTKPQPFNLKIDVRGSARREVIEKERKQQEEEDKEKRKFHAQSDDVVHKKPFIPEKSKKPLTDISGFTLNTEKRHEERAAFDMQLKQKEDELLAQKREREDQKKAEEEAEVAEMRRKAVHKAQPIRNYKPVQVKHSDKPATVPVTPKFATNTRLRSRAGSTMSINSSNSTFSL